MWANFPPLIPRERRVPFHCPLLIEECWVVFSASLGWQTDGAARQSWVKWKVVLHRMGALVSRNLNHFLPKIVPTLIPIIRFVHVTVLSRLSLGRALHARAHTHSATLSCHYIVSLKTLMAEVWTQQKPVVDYNCSQRSHGNIKLLLIFDGTGLKTSKGPH